jgi:hypothetical protein
MCIEMLKMRLHAVHRRLVRPHSSVTFNTPLDAIRM